MARQLYRSITERLLALAEHLLVFPAHYAGSVCGRGLSATLVSSLGFERRHNPALAVGSEISLACAIAAGTPSVS